MSDFSPGSNVNLTLSVSSLLLKASQGIPPSSTLSYLFRPYAFVQNSYLLVKLSLNCQAGHLVTVYKRFYVQVLNKCTERMIISRIVLTGVH